MSAYNVRVWREMNLHEFEELVSDALDELPETIREMLENIEVVARHFPTREQLRENGIASKYGLFGLYEGVPLTDRTASYGMVLPDKITIFKEPIESVCRTPEEAAEEIRRTVKHELAHHFGISDDHLESMGRY